MGDEWDLIGTLRNRIGQIAVLGMLSLCPTASFASGSATENGFVETGDPLIDTPGSYLSDGDRLRQTLEDTRRELDMALALVMHFCTRRPAPHEQRYLDRLEHLLTQVPSAPDAMRPIIGGLGQALDAAKRELLVSAPNAGQWYRLIDLIAPGANPPVPRRYIRTVELEPLAIDWQGIEAGLWVQDIARQFDGAH